MFFFISFCSSAGFFDNLQCGICKKQLEQSKNNVTELFDSLDFTKECTQLTPKNIKMCRGAAPYVFKTFFKIAPPTELCAIVGMCNVTFPKSLRPKEGSTLTKQDLRKKKYTSQCSLMHDVVEYLMHNGMEEFTIPTLKRVLTSMSDDNPIASLISKKLNNKALSGFARYLTSKYTATEFVQETGICDDEL